MGLDWRKSSVKSSISKREKINNISKERKHLNTINVNSINLTKNSNSIEVKNINNTYNKIVIHKIKFSSPWKNFGKKILKFGKLAPSIGIIKNKLYNNKLKIMDFTPKRTNLFYNNINININTINVNENRCYKLKINDFSDRTLNNKKRDKKNSCEKDYSIKYINNNKNVKINFSKLINKVKDKHNIYYYNTCNKNGKKGKSLGHKLGNVKGDDNGEIGDKNIKLYFGKKSSSKNTIISRHNHTSKWKK